MLLAAALTMLAPQQPRDLEALLVADERCKAIVTAAAEHRLQVLLAEPVENPDGTVGLVRSSFGDAQRYFYPASSIKLCGAIALLQELNRYNLEHGAALDLDSQMVIEPRFDGDVRVHADESNVVGGVLTVRHVLRKLFLVSDNQAYNHCLEVVGQDGVNRAMWRAGFDSARLWHRLSEARTLEENAQTRPVRIDGALFAAREAGVPLDNVQFVDREIGTAWMSGGARVDGPMSFDDKNAILLQDLQDVLVEVVRPEIGTGRRGFPELSVEQRAFVVEAMGELPRESHNPKFDADEVPDHFCKFVLPGVRRVVPAEHVRVYDKIGRAYGFTVENAYVEDRRTGRGFFLAVVVYTNPNGVLNDDRYAYADVADPFVAAVGEIVARAVLGPGN